VSAETDFTVHDWTQRGFGNDYILRPDVDPTSASITGWRLGLKAGDVLVLTSRTSNAIAAYVIESIKYYSDPHDMFTGRVRYARGIVDFGTMALS